MLTLLVAALEKRLSCVVLKCMDTVASAKAEIPPRSPQEDITERVVATNKITEKAQATKQPIWADVSKELSDEDFVVVSRKPKAHANQQSCNQGLNNANQRRKINSGTKTI